MSEKVEDKERTASELSESEDHLDVDIDSPSKSKESEEIVASESEDDQLDISPTYQSGEKGKSVSESESEDDQLPTYNSPEKDKSALESEDDQLDIASLPSKAEEKESNNASESEDELLDIPPTYKSVTSPKRLNSVVLDPDVYGDDSEGDARSMHSPQDSNSDSAEQDQEQLSRKQKSRDKAVPKRKASEKAREKTLQELKSKTQKLTRESRISLPYHKPKQLTLDEFLKKRNKAKAALHSSLKSDSNAIELEMAVESETLIENPTSEEVEPSNEVVKKSKESESVSRRLNFEDIHEDEPHPIGIVIPETEEKILIDGDDESMESSDSKIQESQPNPTCTTTDNFIEQEAELNAFLEEKKPKPKRLTIAEMLRNMPGYDKIAKLKPKLGGAGFGKPNPKEIIDLNDEIPSKSRQKTEKGIEQLMDRFARHAFSAVGEPDSKPQHITLHVNKLEKDAEGMLHSVVDEIDYVKTPATDADDLISKFNTTTGNSPRGREPVPGEKLYRLQQVLREQIRAKKAKDYEEKMKLHAMYNEEKELEDKCEDDLPDDEVMDEEEDDLSDSEEEEELDEENMLMEGKQKKRKRLLYVDDEAEDEDADAEVTSDEEDEEEDSDVEKGETEEKGDEDEINSQSQPQSLKNSEVRDVCSDHLEGVEIGLNDDIDIEENCNSVPDAIAQLVFNSKDFPSPNMMDLCSGKFPSQAPATPVESQECYGFESQTIESDSGDESVIAIKAKTRKRLQFSDDDDEDENDEMGKNGSPTNGENAEGKGSDQEQDIRIGNNEPGESDEEQGLDKPAESGQEQDLDDNGNEDFDDEEAELERQLSVQAETPKRPKGLFGKHGQLRKKFVEEEAELSGSEEGSGDEDERGLNFYEEEDGDKEELDEETVRNQIERAHLKRMLDDDDKQIRELQEEYLERGDLEDGKQRERKFRWNNINETWGEEAMMGDSGGEEDDEEEYKKKIADIERRKWLTENSDFLEASEEESQKLLFENSKFLKLGKTTMRKIESFVECSSSFVLNESSNSVPNFSISSLVKSKLKTNSAVIASPSTITVNSAGDKDEEDAIKFSKSAFTSQPLFASPDEPASMMKRGSFLSRGSPSLTRLAELTKVNDSTNNVKSNSRNFVFSVVTPPDQSKQKAPKRPAHSQGIQQPRKMVKVDRSFCNLDDSSKDASIFKWF